MINLALLPHNTKQHGTYCTPPTRYAAGEARFLPCAHHYPGPCFSARTRVGRAAAKMRLACSGTRCSINVAPGSQQLHRSVAASKVA
ncbi:hypothetical protein N7536_004710 [Penicillium majusculum]|nr:hypothetical protein N7536_004710 [Penicillium majusculum]